VVDLVNVLVERTPVHCAMRPVMPSIFKYKKYGNLERHCLPTWEWDTSVHAAEFRHWVEKPDLRELNSEVAEKNEFRALPLFSDCRDFLILDLVLVEIGDAVDDDPGEASSKVHTFMHDEAHYPSREDIILHELVPTLYWLLAFAMRRSGRVTYSPKTLEQI
jgi:hypothetical protein